MKHKICRYGSHGPVAVLAAFAITVFAATVSASSFPEYPLQTGTGSIPPNIMFILDDSGSMSETSMIDSNSVGPNISSLRSRSSLYNRLYYSPEVTYRGWMQHDGTRHTGGASPENIYTHATQLSGNATLASRDLDSERTFYVPVEGATDLRDRSQYYRYQLVNVIGDGTSNLRVVRSRYMEVTDTNEGVTGAGCASSASYDWRNCEYRRPTTTRDEAAEVANFATWYSYHRTRSKVAKAGAAEAFGQLGENFRVGYDSIWNRNGSSSVSGDLPAFPIPVTGNDDGLFKGQNREDWFGYLFRANANGWTPLHGALQRSGEYFEKERGASGPWGPESGGAQLSCRQNFAILTSDGYWNDNSGYTYIGNSDGVHGDEIESANGQRTYQYEARRPFSDDQSETLADVAMHYWKRDLRDDLANNVPSSSRNDAFWQHMSTFAISIGLQGTMPPADVQLIEQGSKQWPNPWRTSGNQPVTVPTDNARWKDSESARRIDDMLHAAVNTGGVFAAASNPQEFADALIDSLAAIAAVQSSGSNVASNGPSLNTGSHLFQATYTSGEWSGDVQGVSIAGGTIGSNASWSMAEKALEDPGAFEHRPVYTWGSSAGVDFPTSAQRNALVRNPGLPTEVDGVRNANYIKGRRSGEGSGPTALRRRVSPIGDIVNSSPFYVPETNNLFIGANDGMLHGVDAATGSTLFSYVPKGLDFEKLALLSSQDYMHHFFVDGGIDVTTTAQGKGRNILVASLGRGGKGVFALDVTNTGSDELSSGMVLWDKTFQKVGDSDYDADMGHLLGAPLVRQARTQSGNSSQTVAIVPNGIDSVNGKAVLFIYRLNDNGSLNGDPIKIQLGNDGTSANPNGLAEARAADITGDGIADYIYAGDLYGNVWRVDITGGPNGWGDANNIRRVFTATDPDGNRQPITAAVALAMEPVTRRVFVLFGTGSYITNGDLTNTQVQSIYAVIDENSGSYPVPKNKLRPRSIALHGVDSNGRAARAWESYDELDSDDRGWYLNLGVPSPAAEGERVVTAPFMRGRAMWFSSIIPFPGHGCDSGGAGYLNAIDAFTGTNPVGSQGGGTGSFIDVDGDGQGDDRLVGQGPEGEEGFIGSVDIGIGMPSQGLSVGNQIYVCGSDAECGWVATPPGSGGPARLRWHELVDGE